MFTPGPMQILLPFLLLLISLLIFIRFFLMPMIIRKIRASHEPLDSQPTVPVYFCSHCGKQVTGNTGTCTSCGAVPTGYRNFCCQCGVPLNPDQIICIRCGAKVAGGTRASQLAPPPPGADIRQVNDHLEEAIIDLLIFLPLGITAMVFSFQTLTAKKNNDYYQAVYCSNVTKRIVYAVRILVAIFAVVVSLISLNFGISRM